MRAFSRSISSAKVDTDSMSFSVGLSSVRSRSCRYEKTRTPATMSCFSTHAVSICSRPRRSSSITTRIWNGGRGFKAVISRMNSGRSANSAPEMASSA